MSRIIIGNKLRNMLISGFNNLGNHKNTLNDINVFPVADGDTGTNMCLTVEKALLTLQGLPETVAVGEIMMVLLPSLTRNARGNSGVILSGFFKGFASSLQGQIEASQEQIAEAFVSAAAKAAAATFKPATGTILTVADAVGKQALKLKEQKAEIFWKEILKKAEEALEETRSITKKRNKVDVVDSGAKGLVLIIEGMYKCLIENTMVEPKIEVEQLKTKLFVEDEHSGLLRTEEIEFLYCTEFVLENAVLTARQMTKFADYLTENGVSLAIVDENDFIKVHIHTNDPTKILNWVMKMKVGELSFTKIENMKHQQEKLRFEEAKTTQSFPYAKVTKDSPAIGFVAVANGQGITQTYIEAGAQNVISGGQSMNPSTEEMSSAIRATNAKTVFVLPNNKNIVPVAREAATMADRKVVVLSTVNMAQGLAVMMDYQTAEDQSLSVDTWRERFKQTMRHVRTAEFTKAVRDSDRIKKGEWIIIKDGGKPKTYKKSLITSLMRTLEKMVDLEHTNFITLYRGNGIIDPLAADIVRKVQEKYAGHDIELQMIKGDQTIYPLIVAVE